MPPAKCGLHSMMQFCVWGFGMFFNLKEFFEKEVFDDINVTLDSLICIKDVRLRLLTISRIGHLLFRTYPQEIKKMNEIFEKSRSKSTKEFLGKWKAIQQLIEKVMEIPESEIKAITADSIESMLPDISLEYPFYESKSYTASLVRLLQKHDHPLSSKFHDAIVDMIPACLYQDFQAEKAKHEVQDINHDYPYWMEAGLRKHIQWLFKYFLRIETSKVVMPSARVPITDHGWNTCIRVFEREYIVTNFNECLIYNEETTEMRPLPPQTFKPNAIWFVGSYSAKRAIYFKESIGNRNDNNMFSLREAIIPKDLSLPLEITTIEDELNKTWRLKVCNKDKLVMLNLKMNKLKVVDLSSKELKITEKYIYQNPKTDCLTDLSSVLINSSQLFSLYSIINFDINKTHLACCYDNPTKYPQKQDSIFLVVPLSPVSQVIPLAYALKNPNRSMCYINRVTSLSSGHLARLSIRDECFSTTLITFKDGCFNTILVDVPILAMSRIREYETSRGVLQRSLLTYDSRSQSVNMWYSSSGIDRVDIKVKVFKIIV